MELQGLPAAHASWCRSRLGQITDELEQALIQRLMGSVSGVRILDAGCGDGVLALELARRRRVSRADCHQGRRRAECYIHVGAAPA